MSPDNVFRVCDQPHPKLIAEMVVSCIQGNIDAAYTRMKVGSGRQTMIGLIWWYFVQPEGDSVVGCMTRCGRVQNTVW